MPPSSSGGTHLVQMLNMLEEFPVKEMGFGTSEGIHILAEIMKRAYADRSMYLGDSDFYDVPSSLTSKEYAKSLNLDITKDKITPSSEVSRAILIHMKVLIQLIFLLWMLMVMLFQTHIQLISLTDQER